MFFDWEDTPGIYSCSGDGEDETGLYVKECPFQCLGPVCGDKECGPDGCGGVCGSCSEGYRCREGQCCEQACQGKECGPDACGGTCGACGAGRQCTDAGDCEDCIDPCEGKECGFDGCGGTCGGCGGGETCVAGICMDLCEGIPEEGCCWGDILVWCKDWNGIIVRTKCGPGENYCGWDPEDGRYECMTGGGEDPSGAVPKACLAECFPGCWWMECGPDGCGGDCGDCPDGEYCEDGMCEGGTPPDSGPESPEADVVSSDGCTEWVEPSVEVVEFPGETISGSDSSAEMVDGGEVVIPGDGGRRKGGCTRVAGTAPVGAGPGGLLLLVLLAWFRARRTGPELGCRLRL